MSTNLGNDAPCKTVVLWRVGNKAIPYWWLAFHGEDGHFAGACIVGAPNLASALITAQVRQLAAGEPVEAVQFRFDVPFAWLYRRLGPDEVDEGYRLIFMPADRGLEPCGAVRSKHD